MAVKVLVVDDEKLIVKGLKFSLEQDDMEVECAYDGEEALEYAKNNQYDIILLDIMLPKLDGMQVCQQIRVHPLFWHLQDTLHPKLSLKDCHGCILYPDF